MRDKFTKEEIENWDSIDYQWAIDNIKKDEEEKYNLIKSVFEFLKPYLNLELYKAEKDIENKEKIQLKKDNKFISQFNTESTQFSINSDGGDVFNDMIEFEEVADDEETPLILEE